MSLLKCPKCGEMFSDSYKECPFCLEDEDFYNGRKASRSGGRRVERPKAPSILGPAMLLVVLLLVGFLVYTFLGGTIAQWMNKDKDEVDDPGIQQPVGDDEIGEDDPQTGEDDPQTDPDPVPVEIKMDKTTLTVVVGKTGQLKATGVESVTWISSDETVATVDSTGKVTGVKAGSATITATAEGATSAACVVTVTAPKKDLEVVTEYGASLYSPNKAFSVNRGSSVDLKVKGTDSTPTWKTSDTSIATVDSDGVVRGKSSGSTTLTVTVDGQTIKIKVTVN